MRGVTLPELGNIPTMSIDAKKIDRYVKLRLTKSRKIKQTTKTCKTIDRVIKPVKKTTIHRELSDIKAVLNWAVRRKMIAFNPIGSYEMPKRDDELSLVYWLEFKNDDELPGSKFGSIGGGSALKFGIYKRKETGAWMTGSPLKKRNCPLTRLLRLPDDTVSSYQKGSTC